MSDGSIILHVVRREQWIAAKTKEIKEATVRGLEPDIQRLVARHRQEAHKTEQTLRAEHRRELAHEQKRAQREVYSAMPRSARQ